MANDSRIFLYITGGRTLWVPTHTAAADENGPVHILNSATPRELSRSFYLFDTPIHLVDDPAAAVLVPGAKTPEDVINAVNEFRQICAADNEFLIQRCYDSNRPLAPGPQGLPQVSQQHTHQGLQNQQQQALPSNMNIINQHDAQRDPASAAAAALNRHALLLKLLQQQNPQQQQHQSIFSGLSPLHQPPPITFSKQMPVSGAPTPMGLSAYVPMNNVAAMHQTRSMPYGGNYMMNPGNCAAGLMPPPTQHRGHMRGTGINRDGRGARNLHGHGQFVAPVRDRPEPLPPLPAIPPEVYDVYMNPEQRLICATMPGPRCTVWLRDHEVSSATKNSRYIFCRGGIVLMLKTRWPEIENSKPVELFDQQACAHFLLNGYCSRSNCLHKHHNESQLREIIAAKHVELKGMTKKERHQLSLSLMERDKESAIHNYEEDRPREGSTQEDLSNTGTVNEKNPRSFPLKQVTSATLVDSDKLPGTGENINPKALNKGRASVATVRADVTDGFHFKPPVPLRRNAQNSTRKVLNTADIGVTDSNSDNEDDGNDFFSESSVHTSSRSSSAENVDPAVDADGKEKSEAQAEENWEEATSPLEDCSKKVVPLQSPKPTEQTLEPEEEPVSDMVPAVNAEIVLPEPPAVVDANEERGSAEIEGAEESKACRSQATHETVSPAEEPKQLSDAVPLDAQENEESVEETKAAEKGADANPEVTTDKTGAKVTKSRKRPRKP
uniref:C3H1-type domain-containing protein n=1 Tax=Trypanosoma congolense (strain IL3000) TaxID=1068625 RepID=G0V026_TRYCI|nr:conserved hypothetical protein [Trypanosoma congolense IL3000]